MNVSKGKLLDLDGLISELISIFREETRYRDWDTDNQRFEAIRRRVGKALKKAGEEGK